MAQAKKICIKVENGALVKDQGDHKVKRFLSFYFYNPTNKEVIVEMATGLTEEKSIVVPRADEVLPDDESFDGCGTSRQLFAEGELGDLHYAFKAYERGSKQKNKDDGEAASGSIHVDPGPDDGEDKP